MKHHHNADEPITEKAVYHRWDLHLHTTIGSPCAAYDPFEIPRYAAGEELDGVVITDHNFGWKEEGVTADRYNSLADAFHAAGIRMLLGVEVSTREGDLLVYPRDVEEFFHELPRDFGKMDHEVKDVLDTAESLGALCALAHPHAYPETVVHAMERFNGARGVFYNPYGIPEIGGSDAHFPWGVGAAYTMFEDRIETIEDLIREVKAGRCRPVRRERKSGADSVG
ncbi:MAG: PHP domain-containing protein [Deltaproteobacteria bacterium]|nr:PHP domain-containing protein [Candidatus Zymogenaceae bacterium]